MILCYKEWFEKLKKGGFSNYELPLRTELFSCTPVLYDYILDKSINFDPGKIAIVFGEYRKWYKKSLAEGKINRYFPFNRETYGWYGGRKDELKNSEVENRLLPMQ